MDAVRWRSDRTHVYRAHNASIASAYLDHRDLACTESRPERFFLNVVLLRVLYAMPWSRRRVWRSGGSRRPAHFSEIPVSR